MWTEFAVIHQTKRAVPKMYFLILFYFFSVSYGPFAAIQFCLASHQLATRTQILHTVTESLYMKKIYT